MKTIRNWLWLGVPLGLAAVLVALGWAALPAYAQGGMLGGNVTSPAGYPLPAGTVVKLFDPGEVTLFGQAQPDLNDGSFTLGPVPNGLYVLKAVPPAGAPVTQSFPKPVSVVNGGVSGLTLALTQPQVDGAVLAPDGLAPAEASVRVYAGDGQLLQHVPAPGGQFLVGGLPAGGYWLQAFPEVEEAFWKSPQTAIAIPGPNATQASTLTLRAAQLWGVVQDEGGVPIPNAPVIAARGDGDYQVDHTSPSGYWAIGELVTDTYTLAAFPPEPGFGLLASPPQSVTLPDAENPYTLTLGSPPKIVQGQVRTNTGTPVENALVLARRVNKAGAAEALTGPAGGYRLDLAPGLWALTVQATPDTDPVGWVYPLPPQLVHFQHNNEPEQKEQSFTVLTADASVTGEVTLPGGGAPPFTVTIGLYNDEGIGLRTQTQPGDGAFSLDLPHGGYKVAVDPADPGYLGPVLEPIRVPPEGTYDLGTIALVARDAMITGTIRQEDGTGVQGIPVVAWRPGAPGNVKTHSGPDGSYALAVSGEVWHVQPAPAPQQPYLYLGEGQQVDVPPGGLVPDQDFQLTTADAALLGVLVDEAGHPLTDADGWASAQNTLTPALHNGAPISHGTFKIYVPAGTYRVAAYLPAGGPYLSTAERQVTVESGQQRHLALVVRDQNAAIAGALWDPRNQDVVSGVPGVVGAWQGPSWSATHIDPGNGTYHLGAADGLWHLNYRINPDAGYAKAGGPQNIPLEEGQTAGVPLLILARDARITGTVLAPDGSPLPGALVRAHGLGGEVSNLWLHTRADGNGAFSLAVPYGRYRLGAAGGDHGWIQPVEAIVGAPPGGVSGGHVLQFQQPDAQVSGTLTVSSAPGDGEVYVWAWSDDGGFNHGRFAVTFDPASGLAAGPYSLDVISGTVWHLGAALETPGQFWAGHASLAVNEPAEVLDLTLTGPQPKPGPVVVTFDPALPQRISLADGTHIFIPAGALPATGPVTLRVVPIATLPHQHHALLIKYGYAFLATDANGTPIEAHFNQDVVISFGYDEADLAPLGIPETWLKPAYFSTTTNQWTLPESYVIDPAANRVVMHIDHFTDFALTYEPAQAVFLPLMAK